MTNATQLHHLSKLDLFTPNDLHPNLPALTFGIHVVGGCDTMMLSTPDVLERKQLIHGMLEGRVWDDKALKRRCANHERILEAMDMTFRSGRWVRKGRIKLMEEKEHAPQRLKTREARDKYVEEQLENERKLLGVVDGFADTAIDGRVKKDRIKLNKEKKHAPQGTKPREAQDNSVGEQLEDERKLLGVVGGSSDKAIDVD
jgi:ubiquitin